MFYLLCCEYPRLRNGLGPCNEPVSLAQNVVAGACNNLILAKYNFIQNDNLMAGIEVCHNMQQLHFWAPTLQQLAAGIYNNLR